MALFLKTFPTDITSFKAYTATLNQTRSTVIEIDAPKIQLMFRLAITALALVFPSQVIAAESKPGRQIAHELKVKVGGKETTVSYWLFLPKSYDNKKSWPLMLFLHGAGERGCAQRPTRS